MALRAVNEEEFVEAEKKWIRKLYIFLSLWILLAGPFYSVYDDYVINMISLSLLLLLFLPVYQHTKKAKDSQNLWWFSMFIMIIPLFMAEDFYLLWLWEGVDILGSDLILILLLLLATIIFFAVLHYYAVSVRKKWQKFEERRTTLLNLSLEETKDIIKEALKNLNTDYSEPQSILGINEGRSFVELESGIKIGVNQIFRGSAIRISEIPKNDTLEPEIEREILRLANLHESN